MSLLGPFGYIASYGTPANGFQGFIREKTDILNRSTEHGRWFREIYNEESFVAAIRHLQQIIDTSTHSDAGQERTRDLLEGLAAQSPRRLSSLCAALRIIDADDSAKRLVWGGTYAVIEASFGRLSALSNRAAGNIGTSHIIFIFDAIKKLPHFEDLDFHLNSALSRNAAEIESRNFPDGPISAIYFAYVHLVAQSFRRVLNTGGSSSLADSEILDRACKNFGRFLSDHETRNRHATIILQTEDINQPPGERLNLVEQQLLQFQLEKEAQNRKERFALIRAQNKQSWLNFDGTILSLVVLGILVGTVFTTKAGYHQPQAKSTRDDMDYYLTIQGMVISILNVLVMAIPALQRAHMPIQNWGWTWLFWVINLGSSIVSVACYTTWQPIVSASLSFAANVAQLLVNLQLLADVDVLAREQMSAV